MKSTSLITAAFVFLAPTLALAQAKNSAGFYLQQPVTVEGTQLSPGHYELSWVRNGEDVTVTFADGKKPVLTALATLQANPMDEQAIETASAGGGTPELQAIDLKGIRIQFEKAIPAAGN